MAIKAISPEKHDIILMTGEGVMIRIKASDIRICGRASQGVILVRTDSEKGGVIDIALADGTEEDEEDISGAGEAMEEGAEETEVPQETEVPENER